MPKSTSNKHVPTQDELAGRWLRKNRYTAYGLGKFLRYQNGLWVPKSEDDMKKEILTLLIRAKRETILPTANLVRSVLEIARIQITLGNNLWNANPKILVCKNGALFIPTRILRPHSPKYYATTWVPYDFDPSTPAPNFLKTLSKIEPEVVDFLQEFAGYTLTIDTQFESALWLFGPPGSGKSTFILGLQTMLGDRSIQIGLANIQQSRFALWNIPGKTLIVATESPSIAVTVTDQLNTLISGESITIEQKYRDPFEIIPHIKIIWAMNDLPPISSAGNGIFRRVQIVRFPPIPLQEMDSAVKEGVKLEGSGILNWALEGYSRLYKRGRFQIPRSVQAATEEYRLSMDIPRQFLSDKCILDPNARTSGIELYNAYVVWCYQNGHKQKSNTAVAEDWKRLGLTSSRSNKGVFWIGVRIR